MRRPRYLSPTAISLWSKSREDYYIQYMADNRPPRDPQTMPMSIGSAFDAFAKNFLHQALFGVGNDPRFDLETLFQAQVEPQNRDWAWKNGAEAFKTLQINWSI